MNLVPGAPRSIWSRIDMSKVASDTREITKLAPGTQALPSVDALCDIAVTSGPLPVSILKYQASEWLCVQAAAATAAQAKGAAALALAQAKAKVCAAPPNRHRPRAEPYP